MESIICYLNKGYVAHKDKILFADEDKKMTYKESYFLIIKLVNLFLKSGLKKGQKVILRTTRTIECSLIIIALQTLGIVTALIDPYKKIDDLKIIEQENFRYDFYISNEKEEFSTARRDGWLISNNKNEIINKIDFDFENLKEDFNYENTINDDGIILFTSGSTGANKCVLLKQRAYMHHIIYANDQTTFNKEDRIILLLPLNHVFGLDVLFGTITKGATLYCPKTTKVNYVAEFIDKYKINKVDSVPSLLFQLYEYTKNNNIKLETIEKSIVGGAPSNINQLKEIEKYFKSKITQVYGMSECFGISASTLDMEEHSRIESAGKVNTGSSIKIIDENNNELKDGEEGEIIYKWNTLMEGYLEKDKLIIPYDKNGYLHTGDIGYLNGNILYVTGRKKDIIIRNGYKISCRALENVISTLPYIKEVAVVPLKDDERGEVPGVLVTVNDSKIKEDQITKDLIPLIKRNEMIGKGKIIDKMPLNYNGKIDKIKVKEILCLKD